MPNVDDHMDDLFRKAADRYPLKTTGSNWEAVHAGLSGATDDAVAGAAVRNRKGKYFWLFLFLIAGSGIVYYYGADKNAVSKIDKPGAGIVATKTLEKEKTSAPDPEQHLPNTTAVKPAEAAVLTAAGKRTTGNTFYNRNHFSYTGPQQTSKPQKQSTRNFDALFDEIKSRYSIYISPGEIAKTEMQYQLPGEGIADGNTDDPASTVKSNNTAPRQQENQSSEATLTNQKQPTSKRPQFYVGAAAGIELNHIKSQQMTKAGLNGGIVAGWRFTSRFAAESGLRLSRKNYYSTGKYFNPKQGMMPAGMEVLSLEGSSTILEIPLTLKYNFTTGKKFYATAGSSSFLLAKEKNNYHAMMSGSPMQMTATYQEQSFYPFASLNIGLGYEHSLNKNIFIRLEPYVQIPVKRIGVGQMPVTSTGIHLIITK